jgi:hypothetical protein
MYSSFGHHHAHEYGVNKGYPTAGVSTQRVMEGFCKTRLSVTKVNRQFHFTHKHLVSSALNKIFCVGYFLIICCYEQAL